MATPKRYQKDEDKDFERDYAGMIAWLQFTEAGWECYKELTGANANCDRCADE